MSRVSVKCTITVCLGPHNSVTLESGSSFLVSINNPQTHKFELSATSPASDFPTLPPVSIIIQPHNRKAFGKLKSKNTWTLTLAYTSKHLHCFSQRLCLQDFTNIPLCILDSKECYCWCDGPCRLMPFSVLHAHHMLSLPFTLSTIWLQMIK